MLKSHMGVLATVLDSRWISIIAGGSLGQPQMASRMAPPGVIEAQSG